MYLSFLAWIFLEATDICLSLGDKKSLITILQTMYPARLSIILEGFIALISILGTDAIQMDCQIGWKRHNNLCYKMGSFEKDTWTKAYQVCKSLGAKLPVPPDLQGVTNFITTTLELEFDDNCGSSGFFKVWLGCKIILVIS